MKSRIVSASLLVVALAILVGWSWLARWTTFRCDAVECSYTERRLLTFPVERRVTMPRKDLALRVEMVDTGGGGAAPTHTGRADLAHGLIGMRERVQMFDGELQAGPCPGGGFRVAARLPLAADGR